MKVLNSRGLQTLVSTILALTLSATIAACADGPQVALTAPDGSTRALVKVEIVDAPSTREFGLMYRKHLDEYAGMIFVFPAPDHLSFWMKNTVIPLDMIFADAHGKIVGTVENAEPFSERPLSVDGDSLYVLEVNGGFSQRHHIHAGDQMKFEGFMPHTQE